MTLELAFVSHEPDRVYDIEHPIRNDQLDDARNVTRPETSSLRYRATQSPEDEASELVATSRETNRARDGTVSSGTATRSRSMQIDSEVSVLRMGRSCRANLIKY